MHWKHVGTNFCIFLATTNKHSSWSVLIVTETVRVIRTATFTLSSTLTTERKDLRFLTEIFTEKDQETSFFTLRFRKFQHECRRLKITMNEWWKYSRSVKVLFQWNSLFSSNHLVFSMMQHQQVLSNNWFSWTIE